MELVKVTDGGGRAEGMRSAEVARAARAQHTVCMKRTNVVLDTDLLEEATRLSGQKTWSATIHRALEEFVRRAKAGKILELRGSGLWEGDLADMRQDRRPRRRKRGA